MKASWQPNNLSSRSENSYFWMTYDAVDGLNQNLRLQPFWSELTNHDSMMLQMMNHHLYLDPLRSLASCFLHLCRYCDHRFQRSPCPGISWRRSSPLLHSVWLRRVPTICHIFLSQLSSSILFWGLFADIWNIVGFSYCYSHMSLLCLSEHLFRGMRSGCWNFLIELFESGCRSESILMLCTTVESLRPCFAGYSQELDFLLMYLLHSISGFLL